MLLIHFNKRFRSTNLGITGDINGHDHRDHLAEDVVIDFRANTDNTFNLQSNVTEADPALNAVRNPEATEAQVPIEEPIIADSAAVQRKIRNFVFDIVRWNVFSMLGFTLVILILKLNLPYLYALVFLWLCNTFNVISLSHNNTRAK